MSNFSALSRYATLESATLETADGAAIIYLRRRFVPAPERFALLQLHEVRQGDRLDNVAAHYLGDPQQFWRICDANRALRPQALLETVGGQVRITLPEGVPGAFGA